jgi:cell division cycle 2-like protein
MNRDLIHGDLKPENIVWVNSGRGRGGYLKFIDFGSSMPYSKFRQINFNVTTITYRAPEILLGDVNYDYKIDVWAMGLIFYFMITGVEIMEKQYLNIPPWVKEGTSEEDIFITMIFNLFGTPNYNKWPGSDNISNLHDLIKHTQNTKFLKETLKEYYDFVIQCLHVNPYERPYADTLLKCL